MGSKLKYYRGISSLLLFFYLFRFWLKILSFRCALFCRRNLFDWWNGVDHGDPVLLVQVDDGLLVGLNNWSCCTCWCRSTRWSSCCCQSWSGRWNCCCYGCCFNVLLFDFNGLIFCKQQLINIWNVEVGVIAGEENSSILLSTRIAGILRLSSNLGHVGFARLFDNVLFFDSATTKCSTPGEVNPSCSEQCHKKLDHFTYQAEKYQIWNGPAFFGTVVLNKVKPWLWKGSTWVFFCRL